MSDNPFVRYRRWLDSYRRALDAGMSDDAFVELVERVDRQVAQVDGHGFAVTPLRPATDIGDAVGVEASVWVKDETGNVGGSHKARHLFGLALHHAVASDAGDRPLAIASCGNAAVAAGIVAKAIDRRLEVYVPTWADEAILERLEALGAEINVAERRAGETGDPAYLRFREAVERGARAFSVQGTDAPATLDGGRTIGWEIGEQLGTTEGKLDRIYIQIGGGALASSCIAGLADAVGAGWIERVPQLFPVQAEGCAPLARAWGDLLADAGDRSIDEILALAAEGDHMRAWDSPHSVATGILDDVTYDWLTIVEPMLRTGGEPVVADEDEIVAAHAVAQRAAYEVSPTGTAGLAGLIHHIGAGNAPGSSETVALLFTGRY